MRSSRSSLDIVQLDADVWVSDYTKEQMQSVAQQIIHRFNPHFGGMRMHVHLRPEGSQVGCQVNLTTDHGHYAARSCDWNLQRAFTAALVSVETQLSKHLGKHTHPLAH